MTHRPRKRFGQNFLQDPGIVGRIVSSIGPKPQQRLVEIGPGRGAITGQLLRACGRLDVVELDRDLIDPLQKKFGDQGELKLHNQDALRFDFCSLAAPGERLRIVGNLPYNISTPLLFHLMEQAHCIEDMHFMLQKEVVKRMAADPGGKAYGRLSVMLQLLCEVEPLFEVDPASFDPAPKVDSAWVRLKPHDSPPFDIHDQALLKKIVTQAFSLRRKTLRNSLRDLVSADQLSQAGIDPGLRAERLAIADFVQLANSACNSPASS